MKKVIIIEYDNGNRYYLDLDEDAFDALLLYISKGDAKGCFIVRDYYKKFWAIYLDKVVYIKESVLE